MISRRTVLKTAVLALAAMTRSAAAATPVYKGFAAHYRPGLMLEVCRNRGLEPAAHMGASPFHPIGSWVTATEPTTGRTVRVKIVDCPHPKDRAAIIRRGIVLEVDFGTAQLFYGIQRVGEKPVRECPIHVRGATR